MDKEQYELKQQQKTEVRERERQKMKIKKAVKISAMVLVAAGVIFALGWYFVSRIELKDDSKLVSRVPIHWHPELSIKILGQEQEIPANIGIALVHQTLHTHEPDGVIHIEPAGAVWEDDIKLGRFFAIWGKTFNQECIFDKCSGAEGQLKMFVNGEPNFEFENYIMRDGDKIEIIYE